MQVGIISYGLDRPLTGIGRYTVELARALADLENGPGVTLLAAGGAGPLASQSGLRSVPLPGCRLLPGLVTLGNVMIPRLARRYELDLVHDPTGVSPSLFGASGARTVVTVHDVFAWSCPGSSTLMDTLIQRYWLPRRLPRVYAVITDSLASQKDLSRYLGISGPMTHVIPHAASSHFRPAPVAQVATARSRYGLPEHYILYVGSLVKRKNLLGLLRSYARLRASEQPLPLVVVGVERTDRGAIAKTVAELDLGSDLVFAGHVADEDLPAVYSGAKLFVFPSLYEGFGLPPLEAMACGTPVVCSNAASLPEVVGDAAITVDPYDVQGLAGAMHCVLADADLQHDLRRRGLERAAAFTWERTARETVQVYREVLKS